MACGSPERPPTCPPRSWRAGGRHRSRDARSPTRRDLDGQGPARPSPDTKLTNSAGVPWRTFLSFSPRRQAALANYEVSNLVHALVFFEVGEQKRPLAAHLASVAVHHFEI